jgi:hypothetical protein
MNGPARFHLRESQSLLKPCGLPRYLAFDHEQSDYDSAEAVYMMLFHTDTC